jgi:hypothetical protein
MNIDDVDYSKIFLINDKKGYRFAYKMNKMRIKTPILFVPFGIEQYNNKEIINFQIKTTNNDQYNFKNFVLSIDKIYEQFSLKDDDSKLPFVVLPQDFIKTVQNLEFSNSYKQDKNLIRTHAVKNIEIFTMNNNKKEILLKNNIKGKNCICEFELSNIWIHNNSYGLLWNVINIEIL